MNKHLYYVSEGGECYEAEWGDRERWWRERCYFSGK